MSVQAKGKGGIKVRTLFLASLLLFLSSIVWTFVSAEAPPVELTVFSAFALALLSTTWFLPLTMGKLASALSQRNQNQMAERVARVGVRMGKPIDGVYSRWTNGPRHVTPSMYCEGILRLVLFKQGKYAEMEKMDRETLDTLKKEGGTSEGIGHVSAKLAASVQKTGNVQGALNLANQALSELSLAGRNPELKEGNRERLLSSELTHALFVRASILESILRYDDAMVDRLRAVEISERVFGTDTWIISPHLVMLAELYIKLGRYAEAEPLLHRALDLRLRQLAKDNKLVAAGQLALSDLYREWGDLSRAESYIEPALEQAEKLYKSDPGPGISEFRKAMAFLKLKQGKLEEAMQYFESSLKSLRSFFPETHPIFLELNERYGELLRKLNRNEEAEKCEGNVAALKAYFETISNSG